MALYIVSRRIIIGLKLHAARAFSGAGAEIVIVRFDLIDFDAMDQKCIHELHDS
jgi:hypothetical protein